MDKIIYVVGFGPGDKQFMTMQAVEIIEQADLIVGYTTYTDILKAQFPDKKYISTPMRKETDRCRLAIEKALEGNTVAMVSSGDSGIYGMAGIMLEIADDMQADSDGSGYHSCKYGGLGSGGTADARPFTYQSQ